jgi:hypothetical protein
LLTLVRICTFLLLDDDRLHLPVLVKAERSLLPYPSRSKVLTLMEVGPDRVFKRLPLVMIGIILS